MQCVHGSFHIPFILAKKIASSFAVDARFKG
jgi:hypothetical protein